MEILEIWLYVRFLIKNCKTFIEQNFDRLKKNQKYQYQNWSILIRFCDRSDLLKISLNVYNIKNLMRAGVLKIKWVLQKNPDFN